MTSITSDRIVERVTATVYRGRPIVVELHPGYLAVRLKGKRDRVNVEYGTILEVGYKILARLKRNGDLK